MFGLISRVKIIWHVILVLAGSSFVQTIFSQELSPRAYWPAPQGTRAVVLGYSYNDGDVLTDPSLPITGVDSQFHTGIVAYAHTTSLWGRTTNFIGEISYVTGTTDGRIYNSFEIRQLDGVTDVGITMSVNILGAPALTLEDYVRLRTKPRPIVAASLKILLPTGAYKPDKIINISANRLAAKFELGFINPLTSKWILELELGAWIFGDNNDFVGFTREQHPIAATEVHIVRRFNPGFWAALDLNFYTGGRTIINGVKRADLQRNSRIGFTIAYPFGGRYSVKAGYSQGVVTASGNDFKMVLSSIAILL